MNYRSVADLDRTLRTNLRRIPSDIDAVVGIPRSGMLCASLVALHRNLPLVDLAGFLADQPFQHGATRSIPDAPAMPTHVAHALIIDDSLRTGAEMRRTRDRVERRYPTLRATYLAVYGPSQPPDDVTILETVEEPRVFGWNLMHHVFLDRSCVDLDTVLAASEISNERPVTADWLRLLSPPTRPTRRIHTITTSLYESDRPIVAAWLAENRIDHRFLVMRRDGIGEDYRRFKAEYYLRTPTELFIEGREDEARRLADATGKPVLALDSQIMVAPAAARPGGIAR